MSYDRVQQNVSAAKITEQYFISLNETLEEGVRDFLRNQQQFEKLAIPSALLSLEIIQNQKDARGKSYTEYRSSISSAKLYSNHPIGWIYGEIEKYVPWTGARKCFALKLSKKDYNGVQSELIGCYNYGEQHPSAYLLQNSIMNDLTCGTITDNDLSLRSNFAEASNFDLH